MALSKAVFFDRDGTLIEDVGYLSSFASIRLIESMVLCARALQNQGYALFVVTNQSGVARGYFGEDFVLATHVYLDAILRREGVYISKFYYCPHHPDSGTLPQYTKSCECRKPRDGMLRQAAREFDIDLTQSLMIGDAERDFDAGRAAGCRSFFVHQVCTLDWSRHDACEQLLKNNVERTSRGKQAR